MIKMKITIDSVLSWSSFSLGVTYSGKDTSCSLQITILDDELAAGSPSVTCPLLETIPCEEFKHTDAVLWISFCITIDCTWPLLSRSCLDRVLSDSGSLSLQASTSTFFLNGWSVYGTSNLALENRTAFLRLSFFDSTYIEMNQSRMKIYANKF